MVNVLGASAGAIITLIGMALIWTPIPVGLILIIIGLSMTASFSPWARERIRAFRASHHEVDERAREVAKRLPEQIREAWEKTDPRRRVDDGDRSHSGSSI